MTYGWIILKDLLHENDPGLWPELDKCVGKAYICSETEEEKKKIVNVLKLRNKGYMFRLIDDDGIPNFEGRFYDDTDEYSEESLYALFSWGMGYAGTTLLTFPHKKEFEIG